MFIFIVIYIAIGFLFWKNEKSKNKAYQSKIVRQNNMIIFILIWPIAFFYN
jgi:uncharacterized membrane protein SirB2